MLDRIEELAGVRHQRKCSVEVLVVAQLTPEGLQAQPLLGFARWHAKHLLGGGIEVGQYAIAVEEELSMFGACFACHCVR